MTDLTALNLRATLAMRVEDLRIARKHFVEAASRPSTPENVRAYDRALTWFDECKVREEAARSAVIRHSLGDTPTASERIRAAREAQA